MLKTVNVTRRERVIRNAHPVHVKIQEQHILQKGPKSTMEIQDRGEKNLEQEQTNIMYRHGKMGNSSIAVIRDEK